MRKNRKKIFLSVFAIAAVSAAVFALYAWKNPDVLFTGRTVRAAGERMGFDMEDSEVFSGQIRREIERMDWASVPAKAKEQYFREFIDARNLKFGVSALANLPPGHREEAASAAYVLIRDYRLNLSPSERERLREYAGTEEGRKKISAAGIFLTRELSSRERELLRPAIGEFEALAFDIKPR